MPGLVALVVEPAIGILGDRGLRRRLVLWGGVAFSASLVAFALAPEFAVLLPASAALYPASGAFVSLSQATLMNKSPKQKRQFSNDKPVSAADAKKVNKLLGRG